VLEAITAQRGKYDAVVVLAYLPEDELIQLAAALPEADVVVGGPTGQSIAPRSVGPVLLASATNKGKFLIDLEAAPAGGKIRWTGQVVEMGPAIPDDPDQRENLTRYLAELERQDFAASDAGLALARSSGLPADYRLAGTEQCASCHKEDDKSWKNSGHAHAWQTLVAHGSQVDPYCQQCHTTGFGMPGGFVSARRSPSLAGVGCESCHGPSLLHSRNPQVRTPFAARDQCERCHDHENSPRFDYGEYWPRIRHGNVVNKQTPTQNELSP
jgi:Cytochrome c554 and c-prime